MSKKQTKNASKGVYLAPLIFNSNGCIPVIAKSKDEEMKCTKTINIVYINIFYLNIWFI
jgi:hypothetical protein